MTVAASVGCHSPLMNICPRPMLPRSPFEMVSFGSVLPKAWEVIRLLLILGILSQTCLITFRDILCEADGTLWLATDIGLVEYEAQSGREVLHQSRPVREPFLETMVSNIKFDGDYIWFTNWGASPNGGIVRFHRSTATWRRFTRLDILKSTQKRSITVVRWTYVDTDAVWFTTDYGIFPLR